MKMVVVQWPELRPTINPGSARQRWSSGGSEVQQRLRLEIIGDGDGGALAADGHDMMNNGFLASCVYHPSQLRQSNAGMEEVPPSLIQIYGPAVWFCVNVASNADGALVRREIGTGARSGRAAWSSGGSEVQQRLRLEIIGDGDGGALAADGHDMMNNGFLASCVYHPSQLRQSNAGMEEVPPSLIQIYGPAVWFCVNVASNADGAVRDLRIDSTLKIGYLSWYENTSPN
nr:hypothetical protein Iba_chr01aCG18410 [Ipomoea batatas]